MLCCHFEFQQNGRHPPSNGPARRRKIQVDRRQKSDCCRKYIFKVVKTSKTIAVETRRSSSKNRVKNESKFVFCLRNGSCSPSPTSIVSKAIRLATGPKIRFFVSKKPSSKLSKTGQNSSLNNDRRSKLQTIVITKKSNFCSSKTVGTCQKQSTLKTVAALSFQNFSRASSKLVFRFSKLVEAGS